MSEPVPDAIVFRCTEGKKSISQEQILTLRGKRDGRVVHSFWDRERKEGEANHALIVNGETPTREGVSWTGKAIAGTEDRGKHPAGPKIESLRKKLDRGGRATQQNQQDFFVH